MTWRWPTSLPESSLSRLALSLPRWSLGPCLSAGLLSATCGPTSEVGRGQRVDARGWDKTQGASNCFLFPTSKRSEQQERKGLIWEKLSKVIDVEEPTEPLERAYLVFRSQIAVMCLCVARIGRPHLLQPVNRLAPAVTMSTKVSGRRLACRSYTVTTRVT